MRKLNPFPWDANPQLSGRDARKSNGVSGDSFDRRDPQRPHFRPRLAWWTLLSLYWLLFPPATYAYIDPGTGSYIVQVVIAGLLGALVSLRIYWARIKACLKRRSPFGSKDPAEHE